MRGGVGLVREQKETKFVFVIATLAIFITVALRCFDPLMVTEPDATFLYNRAYQMLDCIKNGYWPFLYYNDVGGIGYGSPIFYGQLTLLPFLPFLGSISSFINAYCLVRVVVNFFGFRFFVKRYSEYATIAACFYIMSVPFIFFSAAGLYASVMGTGISWFFFGYCVDYFRDGKNFYLLILTYFLTWQCNFNSAVFAVIGCFFLFVCYFDKSRLRDYIRLFLSVLVLLLYNIVNMVTHLDSLRLSDVSGWFLSDVSGERTLLSTLPFGGFIPRFILNRDFEQDLACGFMQFGVLVVFLRYLPNLSRQSRSFKIRAGIVFAVTALGYVLGLHFIWGHVYNLTHAFFQFPIRYIIFAIGFVLVILARLIKPGKLVNFILVVCLVDIIAINPLTVSQWEGTPDFVFQRIVYGEYAGDSFIRDMDVFNEYSTSVHAESGLSYSFVNEYNGLSVDCSTNPGVDSLVLPKLYYNGYKAYGSNGEVLSVYSGYSNYCQVDIGSYTGTLRLIYEVSPVILVCFWLQVFCLSRLLFVIIKDGVICARAKRK